MIKYALAALYFYKGFSRKKIIIFGGPWHSQILVVDDFWFCKCKQSISVDGTLHTCRRV